MLNILIQQKAEFGTCIWDGRNGQIWRIVVLIRHQIANGSLHVRKLPWATSANQAMISNVVAVVVAPCTSSKSVNWLVVQKLRILLLQPVLPILLLIIVPGPGNQVQQF